MGDLDKEYLYEVIADAGKGGITSGEIKDNYPEFSEGGRAFGAMLGALQKQKRICRIDDYWYTVENAPEAEVKVVRDDDTGTRPAKKTEERPFQKGWPGSTVSVYRDPERFGKVIRVQMRERLSGNVFDVPVFGNMKIQISTKEIEDMDIPPHAAPYFGISEIWLSRRRDGSVVTSEIVIAARETVILLPE